MGKSKMFVKKGYCLLKYLGGLLSYKDEIEFVIKEVSCHLDKQMSEDLICKVVK